MRGDRLVKPADLLQHGREDDVVVSVGRCRCEEAGEPAQGLRRSYVAWLTGAYLVLFFS